MRRMDGQKGEEMSDRAIIDRARKFLGKARDGIVKRGEVTRKDAIRILDAAINILRMAGEAQNGNQG